MDDIYWGGKGTASCRPPTGLLQYPHFLCSYYFISKIIAIGDDTTLYDTITSPQSRAFVGSGLQGDISKIDTGALNGI